jgi:TonB family protein
MPNYYPDKAQATNTPGSAVIGCIVGTGGRLTHCTVVGENPPRMGFGVAALQMACLFRVHPKERDGGSAIGTHINVPIRFQLAEAPESYAVSSDVKAAMSLFDRKDYKGALALTDKRLKAQPSDPVALATRGNIYIELGYYEDALKDHDAVLALVGDDQGALVNACWVRALANRDLDSARAYCDKATSLATDESQRLRAYDTRGFLDLRQGQFEAAVADYGHALAERPQTASPLYGRGVAKIGLGRLDEGRTDIVAATKVQHDIAEQYARHGITPPAEASASAGSR